MYGILTGDRALARSDIGDETYYFADRSDGTRTDPVPGTVTTVSCFGDTETVRREPERAAVATDGTRATPAAEGHHWGTVCPTDRAHRRALLERIEALPGDVRLTTLGFPGRAFCQCERCDSRFEASDRTDRTDWRADVITDLVDEAVACVDGRLLATLYPDPYPGTLRERTGVDPTALADLVDGFVTPLCGDYGTPYWVETLAAGFGELLEELDVDLTIQLSVEGSSPDLLADVTRMVEPHCDGVVYGTFPGDEPVVERTIERRKQAE